MSLVELFCHVDDFCQAFEPLWIRDHFTSGRRRVSTSTACLPAAPNGAKVQLDGFSASSSI